MSFTDDPRKELGLDPEEVLESDPEVTRRRARIEALRKDVEEAERRVVRGAGTAYPVGSERLDPPASGLPGIPIGPVDVPTSRYKVEHAIKFSLEQIEGLFLRQSRVNNPELFEILDRSELSSVQFKTLKDPAGINFDTYVLIGTFVYFRSLNE